MVKGWLGRRQARQRGVLKKMGACALCCSRLAEMYLEATEQVGPVGTSAKGGIGHKLGMAGGGLSVWKEGNVSTRTRSSRCCRCLPLSGSRCGNGDRELKAHSMLSELVDALHPYAVHFGFASRSIRHPTTPSARQLAIPSGCPSRGLGVVALSRLALPPKMLRRCGIYRTSCSMLMRIIFFSRAASCTEANPNSRLCPTTGVMLGMLSYHGDDFRDQESAPRPVGGCLRTAGASEEAEGSNTHAARLGALSALGELFLGFMHHLNDRISSTTVGPDCSNSITVWTHRIYLF